jgi:hypothetical protein
MKEAFEYKRFIVQSLIGHYNWNSKSSNGRYYHLGTIPNAQGETHVFDLRMMICATPVGFKPVSVYSRRAELPLTGELKTGTHSWDILGTNLSHKLESENGQQTLIVYADGQERLQYTGLGWMI